MAEIIARTPLWVWAILLVLIILGFSQSRSRELRRIVLILPALGFAGYSLSGVLRSFSGSSLAIAAWLATFAAVLAVARPSARTSAKSALRAPLGRVTVAGSLMPLTLYLGIFMINYALNVLKATNAALLAQSAAPAGFGATLGLLSALLFHRALQNAAGPR
ncbi:MAG: hypothetical protein LCH38_09485 [Proteobacteria bacterium]|nr:hypothetical protein [Pseudomonadota bacterium]